MLNLEQYIISEKETLEFIKRTERQAARFPFIAIGLFAAILGIVFWRGDSAIWAFRFELILLLIIIGIQLFNTKAMILRLVYIYMKDKRNAIENELEQDRTAESKDNASHDQNVVQFEG